MANKPPLVTFDEEQAIRHQDGNGKCLHLTYDKMVSGGRKKKKEPTNLSVKRLKSLTRIFLRRSMSVMETIGLRPKYELREDTVRTESGQKKVPSNVTILLVNMAKELN